MHIKNLLLAAINNVTVEKGEWHNFSFFKTNQLFKRKNSFDIPICRLSEWLAENQVQAGFPSIIEQSEMIM